MKLAIFLVRHNDSIYRFRILRKRGKPRFFPALLLYLGMAVVAEIVNVASHLIIRDIRYEANMFYITPFYPSTQPVFDWIAARAGIAVEIAVYLGAIALGAFGLFLLEFRLHRKNNA